jgi:phage FluMu protein Com
MAIEFRCTKCNKLLRTADDTAGKHAKCPECGEILAIPSPGTPMPGPMPASGFGSMPDPAAGPSSGPSPFAGGGGFSPPPGGPTGESSFGAGEQPQYQPETGNPYQSPSAYADLPAAPIGVGPIRPTMIDAGNVLSRAWSIFQNNLGMCIGAFIVMWICQFAFGWVIGMLFGALAQPAFPMPMQNNPNMRPQDVFPIMLQQILQQLPRQIAIGQIQGLLQLLLTAFLMSGFTVALLKIARGQAANVGDVFSAGKFYLPVLVTMFIFQLMTSIGYLLLIVPGVILYVIFSQYLYLILDRNMGIADSLQTSLEITKGNRMAIFLICLISVGLTILGAITCVGWIFATPLMYMMWVVAYLSMTGQPTVDQYRAGLAMR